MPEWVIESSHLSDTGRKRHNNEDYVGCYEPAQLSELATLGRLYVLADGVGGAAAGEVASQYAVQHVIAHYTQARMGTPSSRLVGAIEAANAEVFAQNARRSGLREMATTLVAAVIHGDRLTVANVGDSRAYLIAGPAIYQISQDHSLVAEMIREGAITSLQAETHPYRNVILRSIGSQPAVKVDVFSQRIAPSDKLVLCSDGLTRRVVDHEIAQIVNGSPPAQAVRQLVDLANERGGEDNITVVAVRITDTPVGNVGDQPDQSPPTGCREGS
jgi:serine/threonine protein phosphatase PrpC